MKAGREGDVVRESKGDIYCEGGGERSSDNERGIYIQRHIYIFK